MPASKSAKPSPELVAEVARGSRRLKSEPSVFHRLNYDGKRRKRSLADSRYLLERAADPKMPSGARGHLIGGTNPHPSLVEAYEAAFTSGGEWEQSWVIRMLSELPDPAGIEALERVLPRYRPTTPPRARAFGAEAATVKRLPRIFALELSPLLAFGLAELVTGAKRIPRAAARRMSGLFVRRYAELRATLFAAKSEGDPYFWYRHEPYSAAAADATACLGALAKVPADLDDDVDATLRDAEALEDPYLCQAAVLALVARGKKPRPAALSRALEFPHTRLSLIEGLSALGKAALVPAAQRTALKLAEGTLAAWCSLDDPPAPTTFECLAKRPITKRGRSIAGAFQFLLRYTPHEGRPQLGWAGGDVGFNGGCGDDSEELRAECLRQIDEVAAQAS